MYKAPTKTPLIFSLIMAGVDNTIINSWSNVPCNTADILFSPCLDSKKCCRFEISSADPDVVKPFPSRQPMIDDEKVFSQLNSGEHCK